MFFTQILDEMRDWRVPINKLLTSLAANPRANSPSPQGAQSVGEMLIAPENAGREVIALRHNIIVLTRALDNHLKANLNRAIANIELLAFSVTWFAQASVPAAISLLYELNIGVQDNFDFPRDCVTLGKQLNDRAMKENLTIPPSILEQFGSTEGDTLFKRMKLCFQAAVTISPLIALIPTQWPKDNIQRQNLLSVSEAPY